MDKKLNRINKIKELLIEKNYTTKDLAAYFGVSEMTIRRDLHVLQNNDIVRLSYGSITHNPQSKIEKIDNEYEISTAVTKSNNEKTRIGEFAATLLVPNDAIIIDTGSTTEKLAAAIPKELPLTVLCYTMNILNYLYNNRNIKLIFTGGFYHPNTQMFESNEGVSLIRRLRATKVFISAAGIHDNLGATCVNQYEVTTKTAILDSSNTIILLADSSKFDLIRPAYFCPLSRFDIIITDNNLSDYWVNYIHEMGIKLYMV